MHAIDLRRATRTELLSLCPAKEIEFVNLTSADVPRLVELGFGDLQSLSLRHLRTDDLAPLKGFPRLTILEVWQSEHVHSLAGLEALKELRWLALHELGPLPSLVPISDLASTLEELLLMGGMWKDQKLSGDFKPLAALKGLRRLTLLNVRGPVDLSPITNLPKLEYLSLATALFPIDQVARVAAAYPFWREQRPWLKRLRMPEQDSDGCSRCGAARSFLHLQRRKRIWCEQCDGARMEKLLADFDRTIESYLP